MNFFERIVAPPNPEQSRAHIESAVIDERRLAFLIGLAAVALPIGLFATNSLLWTLLADRICFQDSISHYYYVEYLGDVLVMTVAFIGAVMLTYRGEGGAERWWARIVALGCFGLALFPTTGDGCDAGLYAGRAFIMVSADAPDDGYRSFASFAIFPKADIPHFISAAMILVPTMVFCFVFFRRVDPHHRGPDGKPTIWKKRRNRVYKICGGVILVCLAALGARAAFFSKALFWNDWNLTFFAEAFTLIAFGFAWLVRGRFIQRYNDPAELTRRTNAAPAG